MRIRVCIVDDDRKTLEAYAKALRLESGMELLGLYNSIESVMSDLPDEDPDVVLMDIRFPKSNGIAAVPGIKGKFPKTSVIMLTVVEDQEEVFDAILAGADGYILKSAGLTKLFEAIRDVVQGGAPMTPLIARKILSRIKSSQKVEPDVVSLSPREREILELIAAGFHDAQIADQLSLSRHTVGNFIRRVYHKLHVQSRAHAVAKWMLRSTRQ